LCFFLFFVVLFLVGCVWVICGLVEGMREVGGGVGGGGGGGGGGADETFWLYGPDPDLVVLG